jgi:hypothetical protein
MRSTIKLGALEAMKLHISELPYSDWHPTTLEPFELQDRLLRTGERSFVLMVAGELPSDLEVEKPYSLEGVFDWYRDCPEQIERSVLG